MKRVLQIVNKMGYGGIETFLMNMYRNIDKNEIQFDFAVATKEKGEFNDEIRQLGGNIYYYTPRRKGLRAYRKSWNSIFKDKEQDYYSAVHMHVSSLTSIVPLQLAKKYHIKKIYVHAHNTYQAGTLHNILNKLNQKRIDSIVTEKFACSKEAGMYVYGKNAKFTVIHNGIDTNKFSFNEEVRQRVRKQLALDEENIAFVNVGRFVYQKNHEFLIDIFKEIWKQNKQARLFLIGKGELEDSIKEKVKENHLEDYVIFMGLRDDIYNLLQAMDAFVLPSHHEGLPVVGIEAQAAGLKMFVSDTISKDLQITQLVKFLSLDLTAKQWADRILQADLKKKDMYEEIVEAGYDMKQISKRMKDYYE